MVGSSRYYDYSVIEEILDQWIQLEGYPDIIIVGGASGVDYLAERWADNNNIPFVVFSEMWAKPRPGLEDSGRGEAPTDLTDKLLEAATHVLAFESKTSKWTRIVAEMANEMGYKSKNSVSVLIEKLEQRKELKREYSGYSRNIVLNG